MRVHAARVRVAWKNFRGALVHDLRCGPPEIIGEMRDAPADDPRCDCGVRELVAAMGAL